MQREIYLELLLDESVDTRELGAEVAEGWLYVGSGIDEAADGEGVDVSPPLLFGRCTG